MHISAYFDDPIFMEEHEKFIKALAARYDGDPRLGGLDLGSYGNWGEWHCTSLGLGKGVVRPLDLRDVAKGTPTCTSKTLKRPP